MKLLAFIFITLCIAAVISGAHGVALISAGMVGLVCFGSKQLDKRDAEFEAAKEAAVDKHDVMHCLQQHDCECARSTF